MKQQKKQQEIKEEDKFTQIYLATNCFGDPNKIYVGKEKSHQSKDKRKNDHIKIFGKQIEFTYIDICSGWSKKLWKPLECHWIEQFRQWGFELQNKNKGGGGPSFQTEETKLKLSNKIVSDEIKKIISKTHLGRKCIPETIEKMRSSKINQLYLSTDERKEKISTSNLKNYKNNPNRNIKIKEGNSKPILQFNKNGKFIREFSSISEAITLLNLNKSGGDIGMCCNNKRKMVKGFIWKYKNDKNIDFSNNFKKWKRKIILQCDLEDNIIKEWFGVNEISKELKVKESSILYCCRGKYNKIVMGYKWKYKN